MKHQHTLIFANEEPGTHEAGKITLTAQVDLQEAYTLVSLNPNGVRPASENHRAFGITTDITPAKEAASIIAFGPNNSTLLVRTAEEINAGDRLIANEFGKAISLEKAPAGAYYVVGTALQSVNAGEAVEFAPQQPVTKTSK